ncbi:MAG TPA: VOC family protein [Thermoanaerobaculia bacterium]|nr:VOC family protein [Thermoanaerobaculia bacterium]
MRSRLIAATIALGFAITLSAAPENKGPKPDVGDGRVAWFDITTTDLNQSKPFYAGLFGWEFTSVKGFENLAAEIVSGGQPIGTLRKAEGKISPYDGVVYIQVKDLPASCAKAKELGGTIPPGFPFDLEDGRGAIALVVDPAGHPVGMYSRTALPKTAK